MRGNQAPKGTSRARSKWAPKSTNNGHGKQALKRTNKGKGKGKVFGRSPNSSVAVSPTCPKAQHPTAHNSYQNSCNSGTVNLRDT